MVEEASGIAVLLRDLAASGTGVSHLDFQEMVARGRSEVPASEWFAVVNFASEQAARWGAQWLLSPVALPDTDADTEAKGWGKVYATCSGLLVEQFPDLRENLARQHELRNLQFLIETRVKNGEGKPVQRLLVRVMSKVAIVIGRAGFDRLSHRLYTASLYPKGTIGRLQ